MEYTFKKTTCEKYDIKICNYDWAIITIDEATGLFQAHSSYGSYNYSWPSHGRKSFKHFILELVRDSSYFLGKVADSNYYYEDETKKDWKEQIIKDRKEQDLTKEEARELWDIIEDIDYGSGDAAVMQLYSHEEVIKKYCEPWYYFNARRDFSPNALYFAKKVMPMLGEIIEKELEEFKCQDQQ